MQPTYFVKFHFGITDQIYIIYSHLSTHVPLIHHLIFTHSGIEKEKQNNFINQDSNRLLST